MFVVAVNIFEEQCSVFQHLVCLLVSSEVEALRGGVTGGAPSPELVFVYVLGSRYYCNQKRLRNNNTC